MPDYIAYCRVATDKQEARSLGMDAQCEVPHQLSLTPLLLQIRP